MSDLSVCLYQKNIARKWYHQRLQPVNAMRQSAQKQVSKFCTLKRAEKGKTHPEKPEKGKTRCVLGAGGEERG